MPALPVYDATLGVMLLPLGFSFGASIGPNPGSDQLTLGCTQAAAGKVSLCNALGQRVLRQVQLPRPRA